MARRGVCEAAYGPRAGYYACTRDGRQLQLRGVDDVVAKLER